MGLALPAVWSHTPGSWPCNELVMEKVTVCALGKISALCAPYLETMLGVLNGGYEKTTSAERACFRFMRREVKQ